MDADEIDFVRVLRLPADENDELFNKALEYSIRKLFSTRIVEANANYLLALKQAINYGGGFSIDVKELEPYWFFDYRTDMNNILSSRDGDDLIMENIEKSFFLDKAKRIFASLKFKQMKLF